MDNINEKASFDNEQFMKRLQASITKVVSADKGKIGETIEPESVFCDYAGKTATFRYQFHPWMLNCNDVMHGGSVALLMDSSMGWLSSSYPDKLQITPTVSIQITYLNPITLSEHIMVEARVNAIKSRLVYASATLYEEHQPDRPLAVALGEYYRMPLPSD